MDRSANEDPHYVAAYVLPKCQYVLVRTRAFQQSHHPRMEGLTLTYFFPSRNDQYMSGVAPPNSSTSQAEEAAVKKEESTSAPAPTQIPYPQSGGTATTQSQSRTICFEGKHSCNFRCLGLKVVADVVLEYIILSGLLFEWADSYDSKDWQR